MRIVLTVVGVSLIEDTLGRLVGKLGRVPGVKHEEVQSLEDALRPLKNQVGEIKDQRGGVAESEATYGFQARLHPGFTELVQVLKDLWRSEEKDEIKRQHSPAELASLSLLTPKLQDGDQVWLLFSETHESAFCAAVLQEVLLTAGADSTLCGGSVRVESKLLRGIQMDAPARVVDEGLHSWAEIMNNAQSDATSLDASVLLNITGGYKGIAPLAAILAAGLSAGDKPIEVFYLYEGSKDLLFLSSTDLVVFDLSLFDRFRSDWLKLPAGGLSWPDESDMLTHLFVEIVVNGRNDLIIQEGAWLRLTTTGSLLLAVWMAKNKIGRPGPVPEPV